MLIVQISDTHVSVPGRLFGRHVDTRLSFERAISRVLTLKPRPDLVLLTGDLAETGAPKEYDFIAEQLNRLPCQVIAIPGNHDLREAMAQKLPACVAQQQHEHLSIVNESFPVRVIGLDTIIPGNPEGEICEQRLRWLRDVLSKSSEKPTLIAMHHPPFTTGFRAMDNYGIKRGLQEFITIVTQHAKTVSAIVCGHAHRMIIANIAGVPVLLSPSSSFPFELELSGRNQLNFIQEPQQFLIHTWNAGVGLVSHAVFVDEFPGPYPLA